LYELSKLAGDVFTLEALKSAGVVTARVQRVKIIKSGSIEKAVTLQGLAVTAGARAAIESAGGKIES
jgi:large subunit ribosomal protein L15